MPSIIDQSILERACELGDDTIIARPGEPIVNIDAVSARRKVNGYIGREISAMMGGADPALVYRQGRLLWRVPILFTTPFEGQLGVVGIVDVDARTGELLLAPDLEVSLHTNANALLKDLARSPAR